jgi:hypothetical protein
MKGYSRALVNHGFLGSAPIFILRNPPKLFIDYCGKSVFQPVLRKLSAVLNTLGQRPRTESLLEKYISAILFVD